MWKITLISLFYGIFGSIAFAQFKVEGVVVSSSGEVIPFANIVDKASPSNGTSSNINGSFSLLLSNNSTHIIISAVGYETQEYKISHSGEKVKIRLKATVSAIDEVTIRETGVRMGILRPLEPKHIEMGLSASGGVESLVKTLPGVSSRNELSSQYTVRGGNFDENLVYINGVEVYRPFLVRSGRQEGLSIINPDLVKGISFSAGGFHAGYGDKMSSVLDIRYKEAKKTTAIAEASLLGANFMLGTKVGKLSVTSGIRYYTNKYLLGTLDAKGEYQPNFLDFQNILKYKITDKLSFNFLGLISSNYYHFVPSTRETSFGTQSNPVNFKIYYDGQEKDIFYTRQGSISLDYDFSKTSSLTFGGTFFDTQEQINLDFEGYYSINGLDNDIGSKEYSDSIINSGVGRTIDHVRNKLDAEVNMIFLRGKLKKGQQNFNWGVDLRKEVFEDRVDEWQFVDSAGYSINSTERKVLLNDVLRAENELVTYKATAFLRNTSKIYWDRGNLFFDYGIRLNYSDFFEKLLISPRLSIKYSPQKNKRVSYVAALGRYYQDPFYKELKTPQGVINKEVKPQYANHYVVGVEYNFQSWGRPFHLSAETYYKSLHDLVPYKQDNLQIIYAGDNLSSGYAAGLDLKVNGEFVKGTDSWLSLSLMKVEEDIEGDYYLNNEGRKVDIGPYKRPGSQLLNINLFFQDYIPKHPEYQFYINLHFGSRSPLNLPSKNRYDTPLNMPFYRRVDLGFKREFKQESLYKLRGLKYLSKASLALEVFNLLDIKNTVSYTWIRTVSNQSGVSNLLAVPNRLTGRRLNLKLRIEL